MAYTSLAALVRGHETQGQANPYTALNYRYDSTHTASGAYQYTNTTWRQDAPGAGVDISQYPTAASAPPEAQDRVFAYTVQQRGLADWTCPGCNPALTSYLATHPEAASLPVTDGGQPRQQAMSDAPPGDPANPTPTSPYDPHTGNTGEPGSLSEGTAIAGYEPGIYGGPQQFGITQSLQSWMTSAVNNVEGAVGKAAKGAFSTLFGGIENIAVRFMVISLALVLIAFAVWSMLPKSITGNITAAVTRGTVPA